MKDEDGLGNLRTTLRMRKSWTRCEQVLTGDACTRQTTTWSIIRWSIWNLPAVQQPYLVCAVLQKTTLASCKLWGQKGIFAAICWMILLPLISLLRRKNG